MSGDGEKDPARREFRVYRRIVGWCFLAVVAWLSVAILAGVGVGAYGRVGAGRAGMDGPAEESQCAFALERLDHELRESVSRWLSQPARLRQREAAHRWEGWYDAWHARLETLADRCGWEDAGEPAGERETPRVLLADAYRHVQELADGYAQVLRLSLDDQQERLERIDALMRRARRALR